MVPAGCEQAMIRRNSLGVVWVKSWASRMLKNKRYSIRINTRKNNRSSRMWVGDNQKVFTGAIRVKSWEVEGWRLNAGRRGQLERRGSSWRSSLSKILSSRCEWTMIRRCSLEQSEWSPEKLKKAWDECRSICINTRKNNGSSRMWVGDDQEAH